MLLDSVWLVFFVTLSLFPGFTLKIPNYDSHLGDKYLPNTNFPLLLIVPLLFR